MIRDINLLTTQKKFLPSSRALSAVHIAAFTLLFLVLTASLILFFLKTQSPFIALQTKERQVSSALVELRPKTAKLLVLHDRLDAISSFLSGRYDAHRVISNIQQELDSDIQVSVFRADAHGVDLTVSSSSLLNLETFLARFTQRVTEQKIATTVKMGSFTFGSDGKYTVSLKGTL